MNDELVESAKQEAAKMRTDVRFPTLPLEEAEISENPETATNGKDAAGEGSKDLEPEGIVRPVLRPDVDVHCRTEYIDAESHRERLSQLSTGIYPACSIQARRECTFIHRGACRH